MSPQTRFLRIDGLTVFAATAFVAGLAALAALDRVGAPEALVRTGGPILTLFGFAAFGLAARKADLSSFITAGRRLPPLYGGLGVVAVAAGVLSCLDMRGAASSDPPILGLAIGLALGALVYAPLLRRFGATSPADVVATRYSRSAPRMVSALAIWTAAALTAFAGYRVAVVAVENAGASNRLAEIVVAIVLACGALPGGMASVASCAAASGVAIVGLAAVGYASGWTGVPPADVAAASALGSPAELTPVVATALASAGLLGFAPSAAASRDARSAVEAGFVAVALCLAVAAAGAGIPAAAIGPAAVSPVAASLFDAATLAGALSLALLGVYGASRALGLALADARRPFGPIPSVRLARMRAAQLIVIVLCAVGDRNGLFDARDALAVAMALTLALAAPLLALAAIPRAGPVSASIGTLAALAVGAALLPPATRLPGPSETLEIALLAAAAAFAAGALACLVLPRRGSAPTPGSDPFALPEARKASL